MSLENSINWAINTSPYSEDPIMVAEGTGWLQMVTGADGQTYWHDTWSDTLETTTNDADIIACGIVGPYQGKTVMAILRDVRDLNSGGSRWIIHICQSALVDLSAVAVNLLDPTKTIQYLAPRMYNLHMQVVDAQPHIESFLGIDWNLLNALLKIQAAETDPNDPAINALTGDDPGSAVVTDATSWFNCLLQEVVLLGLNLMASTVSHSS